jgi:hypothetical protein
MPVVNIYKEKYDVYIGRAGKGKSGYFGNPIRPGSPCPVCKEIHSKTETIPCFEIAARVRLEQDSEYKKRVSELHDKTLGCFCSPKPCHGDVLIKLAGELNDTEG